MFAFSSVVRQRVRIREELSGGGGRSRRVCALFPTAVALSRRYAAGEGAGTVRSRLWAVFLRCLCASSTNRVLRAWGN